MNKNEKLALLGGARTIVYEWKRYNSYGPEELEAATRVIKSGNLSQFLGSWNSDFFGGPELKRFEGDWSKAFQVEYAVAMNSATSGLIAAVGAIGTEPGDEIIVSPWTMCAGATSVLHWNAIPVFADIEPRTFNLDPDSVASLVTPRTRAVIVTHIFGQSAQIRAIQELSQRHGFLIIEDVAQAPMATINNRFLGTIGDIGVFSLNYHKHIHTGEGGVCVTNSSQLAERLQLIRNHAEAVVGGKQVDNIVNMIGYNFRLGEIEAAMGYEQLKKLPSIFKARNKIGKRLASELEGLAGLKLPNTEPGCTHAYYAFPMVLDTKTLGLNRRQIFQALVAEGVPGLVEGYANLHLLPTFQKRIAYGTKGFPWSTNNYSGKVSYNRGICPIAESLHDRSLINFIISLYELGEKEVGEMGRAFRKVWSALDTLKKIDGVQSLNGVAGDRGEGMVWG